MALHARGLITEMETEQRNPKTSYMERLRNFAAARKLAKKYGTAKLRETLAAMGRIEGFPPAQILWNAGHSDVPLHCFFRSRHEPVFRITRMEMTAMRVEVDIEYGPHDKKATIRESITLQRDAMLNLEMSERNPR